MGQLYFKDMGLGGGSEEAMSTDDKIYHEPNSVHISDDWDTIMEDFLDDYDEHQDMNGSSNDEDY